MKRTKITAVLLTVAALVIGVTGCGAKFDAKAYVQGNLDASFKNEISDDFAKLTDGGRESIEKNYAESIEELTSTYKSAGCPEELLEDYMTVTKDLLKACKYTVGDAVKDDKGNYTVPVEIEPISLMSEAMNEEAQTFLMELVAEQGEAMDETAIMNEYFSFLLEKLQGIAANPVYGDATTIEVHVVKLNDNIYEMPMADQNALSAAVLAD